MGFLYAFLVLVASAFIAAAILLVLGSIYFDATHSEIPPGVERPQKLRIIHAWMVGTAVLGRILENLHICTQIQFVRYLGNRRKLGGDSTLSFKDTNFEHVPVRIYQPKAISAGQRKGIIYFHGGGWVIGSIQSHDDICRYIARESESVVVSVGYRLAPEHTFPTPLNDCLTAASHFLEAAEDYGVNKTRVIIAGDSAGGNLAASVCQAIASKPGLVQVCAQILIYPSLQSIDFNLPSYQQNCAVPLLYRERVAFFCLQYLNGNASFLDEVLKGSHVPVDLKSQYRKWLSADNIPKEFKIRGYTPSMPVSSEGDVYEALKNLSTPEFSPLLAEDAVVRLLPEAFIVTSEYDVLRDDGLLYKKRLEDNGVKVTWCHIASGFHGIVNLFDEFPSGKKGLDDIVTFIESLDVQEWYLPSWRIEPNYSTKVLIGNWVEERKKFGRDPGGTGKSTYGGDFVRYPVEVPDRAVLRRMKKQVNGLPKKFILTHHEEAKHQHLVTQYDEQYNRHGYNHALPPLRKWNRHKIAWIPEKSDCPIIEPPTNYGLFEHIVKKWTCKEPREMNSLYTASYTTPPISAYEVRRRPITTQLQKASHEPWLPRSPEK